MSESLSPLSKKSNGERIDLFALYKRVTLSDSLPLLITKEQRERFAFFHQRITLSVTKNEQFA